MRNIEEHVISLTKEKGEVIEIRTKKINEARKNLGHWQEPKMIEIQKQFLVSLETVIYTSHSIFTAGVTRPEAQMLYQGVFRSKVEYPLKQTFLEAKHV